MLAAIRTAAARSAASSEPSSSSASRPAVLQSPVSASASASLADRAVAPASAAARYSCAAVAGWPRVRDARSASAVASRSSCSPCSAICNARSADSVEDSICDTSSEISMSWWRAVPMIPAMQRCTDRRNAWLCDGSIRPLARARSTRNCAFSAPTRSAAATSSGPSSGLSDDTSSVSSTGSSSRRSRSISANLAACMIVPRKRVGPPPARGAPPAPASSPSGEPAAAIAGCSRNGRPAVATISDRTISEVGGPPSVSAASRVTSAGLSAPSDTTGFSRSMAVASERSVG